MLLRKMQIQKLPRISKNKIKKAEKDYRRLIEEVMPFVKKRFLRQYSTNGEWRTTSSDI